MSFALEDHWVWDFWTAADGELFHLFYLHAPRSLGDESLRHRNARIGHAVSRDLVEWTDRGVVLEPGSAERFDASATWTGSVVRDDAGTWRMYYTGTRFLADSGIANVETIGLATSTDLDTWVKDPGVEVSADGVRYETLGHGTWREEAWRDPWVYRDPEGHGWRMLVTARSASKRRDRDRPEDDAPDDDRGVIGTASSPDGLSWTIGAPATTPGAGFLHLEVPQLVEIDGTHHLLFSCDSAHLTGARGGTTGGIWVVRLEGPRPPFPVEEARLLVSEHLYSGRALQDRDGRWVMLAFENVDGGGRFIGSITDPIPLTLTPDGIELSESAVRS